MGDLHGSPLPAEPSLSGDLSARSFLVLIWVFFTHLPCIGFCVKLSIPTVKKPKWGPSCGSRGREGIPPGLRGEWPRGPEGTEREAGPRGPWEQGLAASLLLAVPALRARGSFFRDGGGTASKRPLRLRAPARCHVRCRRFALRARPRPLGCPARLASCPRRSARRARFPLRAADLLVALRVCFHC